MYKNKKNQIFTKQLSYDFYPNMYMEESIFSTLASALREYLNVHAGESGLSFLLLTNRTLDLMYITLEDGRRFVVLVLLRVHSTYCLIHISEVTPRVYLCQGRLSSP